MADEKEATKLCNNCNYILPIEKFERIRNGNNYRNVCISCRNSLRAKKYTSTPEGYLQRLFLEAKRRATIKKLVFSIDESYLPYLWSKQNGRCALSGVVLTYHRGAMKDLKRRDFNASLDRINPAFGYVASNLQLVAYRVNIMKHVLEEDMFMWWIKTLYDNKQ